MTPEQIESRRRFDASSCAACVAAKANAATRNDCPGCAAVVARADAERTRVARTDATRRDDELAAAATYPEGWDRELAVKVLHLAGVLPVLLDGEPSDAPLIDDWIVAQLLRLVGQTRTDAYTDAGVTR